MLFRSGNLVAPGVGGYVGAQAGQAIGGGVESALNALSEGGRRNPSEFQVNNLNSFRQQPGFGERFGENLGSNLINQGADIGEDALSGKIPGYESQEELSPEQQVEALLESLSPESRSAILAKYVGAQ